METDKIKNNILVPVGSSENVVLVVRGGEIKFENGILAYNAFPVVECGEYKKRLETARKWAVTYKRKTPLAEFKVKNYIQGQNIQICSYESREYGGRAWKVVIPCGGRLCAFDLREDILLDAIKNTGIAPGGKLIGEYKFVQYNGECKLVRNTEYLNNCIRLYNSGKTEENLVVGRAYMLGNKGTYYLGEYYRMAMKSILDETYLYDKCHVYSRGEAVGVVYHNLLSSKTKPKFKGVAKGYVELTPKKIQEAIELENNKYEWDLDHPRSYVYSLTPLDRNNPAIKHINYLKKIKEAKMKKAKEANKRFEELLKNRIGKGTI